MGETRTISERYATLESSRLGDTLTESPVSRSPEVFEVQWA
jgi:hypothetical protein